MSDCEWGEDIQDVYSATVQRAAQGRGFAGLERLVQAHGNRTRRRVALTFDDGPVLRTAEVLKTLRDRGARGTFFLVGRRVPGHEELVRRIVAEGHEVGNHSFDHQAFPSESDVATATALIQSVVGFAPSVFRPPFGAIDTPGADAAQRSGMRVVLWDVDSRDAIPAGVGIPPNEVRANVVDAVREGSIVLMHDGAPWSTMAEALPELITALQSRGYELVTVSELLEARQGRASFPRRVLRGAATIARRSARPAPGP